jgi:ApaG protein
MSTTNHQQILLMTLSLVLYRAFLLMTLSLVLYRAFLREARALRRATSPLLLSAPLLPEVAAKRYGRGSFVKPQGSCAVLAEHFPGIPFSELGVVTYATLSGDDVMSVVRRLFRARPRGALETNAELDAALAHLSTFNALRANAPCHTRTTTKRANGVIITVEMTTMFLPQLPLEACIASEYFPFAYCVRVSNEGTVASQIVGRHWLFTDAKGGVIEVPRGSPGVVGQTPMLQPGAVFEYVSGVHLCTHKGEVEGAIRLIADGRPFDALVSSTVLTAHHA